MVCLIQWIIQGVLQSFEAHLELSIESSKPLFLHERDAHEKFIEITSPYLKDLPKSGVILWKEAMYVLRLYWI